MSSRDTITAPTPGTLHTRASAHPGTVTLTGPLVPPFWIVERALAHDVRLLHAGDGLDPLGVSSFADLYGHARSEQILRALSRQTNLVLPGARIAVVGDGAASRAVSVALRTIGARVVVVSDDPVRRLAAHLAGFVTDAANAAAADYTVLTGEGTTRPGVGVTVDATDEGVAGARVVVAPALTTAPAGGADGRIADALLALVLLASSADDTAELDRRLAAAALA